MIQKIAVCGLGKLGAPLAATFAHFGVKVSGLDPDDKKVADIVAGRPPVNEPFLDGVISRSMGNLSATTHPDQAVVGTDACIFVTPTPSLPDGSFDNSYLLKAIEQVAQVANEAVSGSSPYFFIVASTVTPGTCVNVLRPKIAEHFKKPFYLVYKPEFIALGSVINDLQFPDFHLIGGEPEANSQVADLYRKITRSTQAIYMSCTEAELAKISINCAVTMKISFANQVGMVAEKLGADPFTVLAAVGQDRRIGQRYLKSGMSFGGPCFPRDNKMFQYVAEKVGVIPHLAIATDRINYDVLTRILYKVHPEGDVGILGLTYKPGAPVTEKAAGKMLAESLAWSRNVRVHDPIISPSGLEQAISCKTVIVTIDASEYRTLEFSEDTVLIDPLRVTRGFKKGSLVAAQ